LKAQWCIPPEANAEFACAMEAVLEVYQRSYDDAHPLIGMDESSKQLVKEVRSPLPGQPGEPEKYDYEYERNGVSNLFLFFEPLTGKRYVNLTEQRTAVDWAHQIQELVDLRYPHAERITLVMDNLNGHFISLTPPWMKVRSRPEECLPKVAVGMVVRLRPQHEPVVLTCTSDCCL
jgi:hypothetical protein